MTSAFKLAPPGRDGGPEHHSCEERMEHRYEIVPSVVCSMCCLFGIVYCFFGNSAGPGRPAYPVPFRSLGPVAADLEAGIQIP